ncbi:MAG: YHS domain-containing (seleno)protein [Planctomycetota bacterium]
MNTTNDNVAIHGYDPVSYVDGAPQIGQARITCTHDGAVFRFTSEQTQSTFESNPEKYVPQYGGFCAVSVAQGKTTDIDPICWTISNGKLFLFENSSAQSNWESNEQQMCQQANMNWSKGQLAAA